MRLRHILPAVAALALTLTACTTPDAPAVEDTVTTDTTPAPDQDMTQLVVDLSWDQQTEDDRDAMCLGVTVYGTDWAAEQMAAGAGDQSVDWDRAAELVAQKCAQR